jgi:hypothetical protein
LRKSFVIFLILAFACSALAFDMKKMGLRGGMRGNIRSSGATTGQGWNYTYERPWVIANRGTTDSCFQVRLKDRKSVV